MDTNLSQERDRMRGLIDVSFEEVMVALREALAVEPDNTERTASLDQLSQAMSRQLSGWVEALRNDQLDILRRALLDNLE